MERCIRCERYEVEDDDKFPLCLYCFEELKEKYGEIGDEIIDLYRKHWEFLKRWREGENNQSDEKEVEK